MLADVPADSRLLREEIFGPVAPVATFTTEQQALSAANDSEFGLVAYVFTRDFSPSACGWWKGCKQGWSGSTRA